MERCEYVRELTRWRDCRCQVKLEPLISQYRNRWWPSSTSLECSMLEQRPYTLTCLEVLIRSYFQSPFLVPQCVRAFPMIVGVEDSQFSNHNLLEELRRNTNRDILLYGDWGSTRPREDGFGQAPFPRIDYATNNSWHFSRNRDERWDYQRAAMAIIECSFWDGRLLPVSARRRRSDLGYSTCGSLGVLVIDTPQNNVVASHVNVELDMASSLR